MCECNDGTLPNGDPCQECCEHDETDHGICLSCGADRNEWIGAARYDSYKVSRGG